MEFFPGITPLSNRAFIKAFIMSISKFTSFVLLYNVEFNELKSISYMHTVTVISMNPKN